MPTLSRAAKVAGAGVVALAVGWFAVSDAIGAFARDAYHKAESARIAQLTEAALDPRSPRPGSGLPRPAVVLARQPLDTGAFTRAALETALGSDAGRSGEMMRELLRRNPRSRPARLWLMQAALKQGDVPGAVAQIDRLMALDPQARDRYFPALAELARLPAGERAVAGLLARSPPWREYFLAFLTTRDVGRDLIFRLSLTSGKAVADSVAQAALLQSMIAAGNHQGAYLAWINLLPKDAVTKVTPIYDGEFAGLPGPKPFNWTFVDGQVASAGIERGQGLQVDYAGTQDVQIAAQTLLLEPGAYQFEYVAHGSDASQDGGTLSWRLSCVAGNRVILDLPVTGLTDQNKGRRARFAVPEGCQAQQLVLAGAAGTFPASRSVTFARVAATGVD